MRSSAEAQATRVGLITVASLAAVLLTKTASAQDTPEPARCEMPWGSLPIVHAARAPDNVTHQLWIVYKSRVGSYQDDVDYIETLQTRWHAAGVEVGVIMPEQEALAVANDKPGFVVLSPDKDDEFANYNMREHRSGTVLLSNVTDVLYTSNTLDGMDDTLRRLTSKGDRRFSRVITVQRLRQLDSLIAEVADGGTFGATAASCLKALPKSGRAHAAKVLCHWWCEGDLDAGRAAAIASLEALATERLPLFTFADLILRGDRNDPELAKMVAAALAPFAKSHKHVARDQLVFLRALLHAGNDHRTAGRVAATLPKLLKGRPIDQVIFAETLMEAETPIAFRDQAERALTQAEAASDPSLKQWIFCARHKVLSRCGDTDAAAKLMVAYRKDPVGQTDLNNDAWYLMVKPATMGRFNTLAFAQARKMEKDFGDGISANTRDTLALAYFLSGDHERALELQALSAKAGGDPLFNIRLRRYQETVARKQTSR